MMHTQVLYHLACYFKDHWGLLFCHAQLQMQQPLGLRHGKEKHMDFLQAVMNGVHCDWGQTHIP